MTDTDTRIQQERPQLVNVLLFVVQGSADVADDLPDWLTEGLFDVGVKRLVGRNGYRGCERVEAVRKYPQ